MSGERVGFRFKHADAVVKAGVFSMLVVITYVLRIKHTKCKISMKIGNV